MALRQSLSVGLQTAMRSTSPTAISNRQVGMMIRTLVDTAHQFKSQQESIKQCWHKLTTSEQLVASMLDKILTSSRQVEQINERLNGARAAVVKKKQMCEELKQLVDFSRCKLTRSGQASTWREFHTKELDKKVVDNARWINEFNSERTHYQLRLRSVLAEVSTVKCRLEDADEAVRYIEDFREQLEEEHEDELSSLKLAIREAYVTRNNMMSSRQDAMSYVVDQLVPDDEDYDQLVAETEDLNMKCINLKRRLNEQSKEMLYYHSRNHELTVKIKQLAAQVKDARDQRMPELVNVNAHAQILKKHPVTWFESPNVSIDTVKNFLVKKHGPEAEASVIRYLKVKSDAESRWHSQMFEKEYVEYERTLDVLAELLERKTDPQIVEQKQLPVATREYFLGKDGSYSSFSSSEEEFDSDRLGPSPTPSERVSLTLSELQLCAQSAGRTREVLVDDIGEINRPKVTGTRPGLIRRLQAFFKR